MIKEPPILTDKDANLPIKKSKTMKSGKEEQSMRADLLHDDAISQIQSQESENTLLYRCLKTACHEICHVLGMTHCPYYECLMNGSNLVTEADKKPFALCPICLRKMSVYLKLSNEMIHGRYLSVISSVEGYNNPMF